MRVLAIDFGTVRIGTALSDELGMFASPHKVVPYSKDAPSVLAGIVMESGAATVVIGMPYALDGSQTEMTRRTKNFAEKLRAILPCPVIEWDEAFSSRTAGTLMRDAGMRKKRRQEKGKTDTWAAAVILQGYLDSCRPRIFPQSSPSSNALLHRPLPRNSRLPYPSFALRHHERRFALLCNYPNT